MFKPGDRVVCVRKYGNVQVGEVGTYVHTHTNYPPCGVAWDKEYKYRHSCASHCEEKHGFYVPLEDIELLSMPLDLGELTHHGDVSKFLFGG